MAIRFADEPGHCPDPSSTPDPLTGGFCASNFSVGPAVGKFCWDRQPDYSAFRESSFGHGILEVPFPSYLTSSPRCLLCAMHHKHGGRTVTLNKLIYMLCLGTNYLKDIQANKALLYHVRFLCNNLMLVGLKQGCCIVNII